ncbi:MAG: serine/threonine protein kinase [Deltaproteobacteria bacterium]|nr:serine/threonine protein kinase [Deltaproteobacteria bacterium]
MGAVYRATNPDTGAAVAIKVMNREVASSPDAQERFRREAGVVSRLDTAHVCKVYDFGTAADGTLFLVMELMKGHTLREEITPGPAYMDLARVQMVMSGTLKGLAAAHRAGVIHRDLKPDNVFVHDTFDGEVPKLLDFGIARVASTTDANLTRTGTMMGTASYMAPEQITGAVAKMGPWTDTYAMGAILYEMLAGAPAFGGATVTEVLHRVLQGEVVALRAVRPGLPDPVYALIDTCLHLDSAKRPQDAEAMRRGLLAAGLADVRADVPPPSKTRVDRATAGSAATVAVNAAVPDAPAIATPPAATPPTATPPAATPPVATPPAATPPAATQAAPTRRSALPLLAIGAGLAIAGIAVAVTVGGGSAPSAGPVAAPHALDAGLAVAVAPPPVDAEIPRPPDAIVVDPAVAPVDAVARSLPTPDAGKAEPALGRGPFFCFELNARSYCFESARDCRTWRAEGEQAAGKPLQPCAGFASAYCYAGGAGTSLSRDCYADEASCTGQLRSKDPKDACRSFTAWPPYSWKRE